MSMSILNYFGKVNSQYKKYNCQIPEYTSYVFNYYEKYEQKRLSLITDDYPFSHSYSNKHIRHKNYLSFKEEIKFNPQYNGPCPTGRIIGMDVLKEKEFIFNKTDYPNSNPLNLIENFGVGLYNTIEIQDTYCSYLSPELYIFSFTNLFDTFSKCIEKVKEKLYSKIWNTIECCPLINIIDLLILKQSDTDKHIEHIEQMFQSLIDDNKLLQNKINVLEKHLLKPIKEIKIAHAVEYKTVGEEIFYEAETESLSEL